jgi:hypothetical protein
MRTRHIFTLYVHCVSISEGKHRPLFAPADIHKTSCIILQLFVQRAIANLRYYLLFKMASSGYQTLCYVRLPVPISVISKSLPHGLVNRQAACGTSGHCSLLLSLCCSNKQLSNQHIFTALPHFPLSHRTLCQHTHTTCLQISCPVRY